MTKPDWVEKRDWRKPLEEPRTFSDLRLSKVPYTDWLLVEGSCDGRRFRHVMDGCAALREMPKDERHAEVRRRLADVQDLSWEPEGDKLLDDDIDDEDQYEDEIEGEE